MQIQKEEVREAIIQKAEDEFFKHGFEKASIRNIAKAAGTTIGNLYNYFRNKEELFYVIVTPVYESFIYVMKEHHTHQKEHEEELGDLKDFPKKIHELIKGMDQPFNRGLVILIDGSKGTKYEFVREEILLFIITHFESHLGRVSVSDYRPFHPYFARGIASGFLDGLLDILRKDYGKLELEYLLGDYILFYILGLVGLQWNREE